LRWMAGVSDSRSARRRTTSAALRPAGVQAQGAHTHGRHSGLRVAARHHESGPQSDLVTVRLSQASAADSPRILQRWSP
jgi:hypothetical protein